jgi:antirestriction protein ArdC
MSDKSKALKKDIEGAIDRLAAMTDQALFSDEMSDYLSFLGTFHNYSINNVFLIMLQNSGASLVKGYKAWQEVGRQVRKGEKAIKILAPCTYKACDLKPSHPAYDAGSKRRVLVGFRVASVFDVDQTDGDDLPSVEWRSLGQSESLRESLIAFAAAEGIDLTFDDVADQYGGAQGMSKGGSIVIDHEAGVKTIVHELAHEMLDHHGKGGGAVIECEAESVAFVVSDHFGVSDLASPNYVALHGADSDVIKKSADRIRKCASQIIKFVESDNG